jgi:hypothetical protein
MKLMPPKILPPSARFFFHISRFGMAATGIILSAVLLYSIHGAFQHKPGSIGDIISACNALSIIAMTVFGYHASKYGTFRDAPADATEETT